MRPPTHLRVVTPPPAMPAATVVPDAGEVALVGALFALNLVPVAGELAGVGHWSAGIVGFATIAVLLTGRELSAQLRARVRSRGQP